MLISRIEFQGRADTRRFCFGCVGESSEHSHLRELPHQVIKECRDWHARMEKDGWLPPPAAGVAPEGVVPEGVAAAGVAPTGAPPGDEGAAPVAASPGVPADTAQDTAVFSAAVEKAAAGGEAEEADC